MKKLLALIGLAMLVSITSINASTNGWLVDIIEFLPAADQARSMSFVVAPSYAPEIVGSDGNNSPWGLTAAALYPVLDLGPIRSMAGVRLDYLADQFWTPSVSVQIGTTARLFGGMEVTPFVTSGAIFPLSQGNDNGDNIGAIIGSGISTKVFKWNKGCISLGYSCEKWTPYPGLIHHVGAALTTTW
jgi:hypothetical protein